MNRFVIVGAAMAVIVVVGYFYVAQNAETQMVVTTETQNTETTIFGWSFRELPEGEYGQPNTEVSLHMTQNGTKSYVIGTYPLSCSENQAVVSEPELNQVTSATCWWAGGGVELGVFQEGGKYIVKEAEISEGIEGESMPPKEFKARLTLE